MKSNKPHFNIISTQKAILEILWPTEVPINNSLYIYRSMTMDVWLIITSFDHCSIHFQMHKFKFFIFPFFKNLGHLGNGIRKFLSFKELFLFIKCQMSTNYNEDYGIFLKNNWKKSLCRLHSWQNSVRQVLRKMQPSNFSAITRNCILWDCLLLIIIARQICT